MAVTNHDAYQDILKDIQSAPRRVYYNWIAEFVNNGTITPVEKVVHIDEGHNFEKEYTGVRTVEIRMKLDAYMREVYPFRKDILMTLRKVPISEAGDSELDAPVAFSTYKVVPLDNSDVNMGSSRDFDASMALSTFQFQLLELVPYKLEGTTTGGMFRKEKAIDVLQVLLGNASQAIDVPSNAKCYGVQCEKASVEDVRNVVVIPHGIKILDLPGYMQDHCGGIYSSGMGQYYMHNRWFLFSLYDTKKYPQAEVAADIIIIPVTAQGGADRTYAVRDGRLMIAATGDVAQRDASDLQMLENGNGVRFIRASQSFNSFLTKENGKVMASINKSTSQFLTRPRFDGVNVAPFASVRVTDNVAAQMTRLQSRNGQIVNLMWNNSQPELLYPGMPIKLHYKLATKTVEVLGVLLQVQSNTSSVDGKMTTKRYKTDTSLTIWLSN